MSAKTLNPTCSWIYSLLIFICHAFQGLICLLSPTHGICSSCHAGLGHLPIPLHCNGASSFKIHVRALPVHRVSWFHFPLKPTKCLNTMTVWYACHAQADFVFNQVPGTVSSSLTVNIHIYICVCYRWQW